MDLQAEAVEVLSELIRFDTVDPPGNERDCQEWLARYLTDAGLECELAGADPQRAVDRELRRRRTGEQLAGGVGVLELARVEPAAAVDDEVAQQRDVRRRPAEADQAQAPPLAQHGGY